MLVAFTKKYHTSFGRPRSFITDLAMRGVFKYGRSMSMDVAMQVLWNRMFDVVTNAVLPMCTEQNSFLK